MTTASRLRAEWLGGDAAELRGEPRVPFKKSLLHHEWASMRGAAIIYSFFDRIDTLIAFSISVPYRYEYS